MVCRLLTDGIMATAMTTSNLELLSLADRVNLIIGISKHTKNVDKIGYCNVYYISFYRTYVSGIQLLAYLQKLLLTTI
jgi:hypothetical protein